MIIFLVLVLLIEEIVQTIREVENHLDHGIKLPTKWCRNYSMSVPVISYWLGCPPAQ